MAKWKPIETAPRDGSPVLIAYRLKFNDPYYDHKIFQSVCWRDGDDWRGGPAQVPTFLPTHWMPLPEPPND